MPDATTLIPTLLAGASTWRGRGINHEGEDFVGELRIEPLPGRCAVLLRYTATLVTGTLAHAEVTLLGPGPDGRATLWPVMSELPVVLPHVAVDAAEGADPGGAVVFESGPRDAVDTFREAISIHLAADGTLTYAHAWGLPGGEFDDRSWCRMTASEG